MTDRSGSPYQYLHYTAWGESFAQAEASQGSFSSSYRFNAKELDAETGNYYYGARYYHPKWSVWLGVDPLASKYPHLTPYNFVEGNPVRFIDPTGMGSEDVENGPQLLSTSTTVITHSFEYTNKAKSEGNDVFTQTTTSSTTNVIYTENGTQTQTVKTEETVRTIVGPDGEVSTTTRDVRGSITINNLDGSIESSRPFSNPQEISTPEESGALYNALINSESSNKRENLSTIQRIALDNEDVKIGLVELGLGIGGVTKSFLTGIPYLGQAGYLTAAGLIGAGLTINVNPEAIQLKYDTTK
jgi:RHS repeat-associated protein